MSSSQIGVRVKEYEEILVYWVIWHLFIFVYICWVNENLLYTMHVFSDCDYVIFKQYESNTATGRGGGDPGYKPYNPNQKP